MQLMNIVHYMWITKDIPQELGCNILVLIPKENTDTQGFVLLEMLLKIMEAMIDACLGSRIYFHNILHKLCAGRGTWTSTMDIKITPEISIDLKNSYNTVNRGRLIRTL